MANRGNTSVFFPSSVTASNQKSQEEQKSKAPSRKKVATTDTSSTDTKAIQGATTNSSSTEPRNRGNGRVRVRRPRVKTENDGGDSSNNASNANDESSASTSKRYSNRRSRQLPTTTENPNQTNEVQFLKKEETPVTSAQTTELKKPNSRKRTAKPRVKSSEDNNNTNNTNITNITTTTNNNETVKEKLNETRGEAPEKLASGRRRGNGNRRRNNNNNGANNDGNTGADEVVAKSSTSESETTSSSTEQSKKGRRRAAPKKKTEEPKIVVKSRARAPKSTSTRKRTAAKPKNTVVHSLCGSSSMEVVGDPHPKHDMTLGGQRRQKHGSWFSAVESPWLASDDSQDGAGDDDDDDTETKATTTATTTKPSIKAATTISSTKSNVGRRQQVKYTNAPVDSKCGSLTFTVNAKSEPHPVYDLTLGGQRRQRHGSWHDEIKSPWLAPRGDTRKTAAMITAMAEPLPSHPPKEKQTQWVSQCGSHTMRARGGVEPHPRHDLTLGGQRKQKHSWTGTVATPWLDGHVSSPRRPDITHFVSIPISDNNLVNKLTQFQNAVIEKFPKASAFRIHPSRFHITIGLIFKPAHESMVQFESRLSDAFHEIDWAVQDFVTTAEGLSLRTGATSTFQDAVSIVDLTSKSLQIVRNLATIVYEQLVMEGIEMDGPNDHPHITLFKQGRGRRGARSEREPFSAKSTLTVQQPRSGFGDEKCNHIDLCCMRGEKRDASTRAYETLASIEF